MTFVEFVEHNKDVLVAFMTFIPATVGAIAGIIGAVATYGNRTRTNQKIESVREDLKNGVGETIAQKAVEHMKPAIDEAAATAANGLKQVATSAANGLKEVAMEAANGLKEAATIASDKIVQGGDEVAAKLAEVTGTLTGDRKEQLR